MIKTEKQLIIENETLRSQIDELNDALEAIRSGDVDAIVVSGTHGDQVYSVSSAEAPYRTFIEEMSEGAVTLAKDGTILYCNQRFAQIVASPIEQVMGSHIKRFIITKDRLKLDTLLKQLTPLDHDIIVVSLINTVYLRLSISLLPPYLGGNNFILIATDISDLVKKELELKGIINKLEHHLNALRTLHIDNIINTVDDVARKSKLEIANDKLLSEIKTLNSLVDKLKQKK